MTITCNKCGIVNGFIEEKGTQVGLYCNKCGKWIKWLAKDETRLFRHNEAQMLNENRQAGYNHGYTVGYNEAIDVFITTITPRLPDVIYSQDIVSVTNLINEIAERLKAGDNY